MPRPTLSCGSSCKRIRSWSRRWTPASSAAPWSSRRGPWACVSRPTWPIRCWTTSPASRAPCRSCSARSLELWHRRHGRWLRAEEYRAIGGVRQAIAHTADALYLQLDPADQARARRLFLRLVRVDEGPDHRDTRRRAALDDLARDEADRAATVALVKRLADARLVVTSVNPLDGRAEVELAHETLITAWGRLQGWIEQDRAGLVVRQRLAEDARTWERSGRQGDYLYRRAQLEPALAVECRASGRSDAAGGGFCHRQ